MKRRRTLFSSATLALAASILLASCSLLPLAVDRARNRVERIENAVAPMARAALSAGQLETARRLYQRLLEVDPASVAARMGLGAVSMAARDPAQAAVWYQSAVAHVGDPAARHTALLAHGRAAVAAGDLEAARRSFSVLADPRENASDDHAAWAFNGLGTVCLLEGEPDCAVASVEKAALRDPHEPALRRNLAFVLKTQSHYRELDAESAKDGTPIPADAPAALEEHARNVGPRSSDVAEATAPGTTTAEREGPPAPPAVADEEDEDAGAPAAELTSAEADEPAAAWPAESAPGALPDPAPPAVADEEDEDAGAPAAELTSAEADEPAAAWPAESAPGALPDPAPPAVADEEDEDAGAPAAELTSAEADEPAAALPAESAPEALPDPAPPAVADEEDEDAGAPAAELTSAEADEPAAALPAESAPEALPDPAPPAVADEEDEDAGAPAAELTSAEADEPAAALPAESAPEALPDPDLAPPVVAGEEDEDPDAPAVESMLTAADETGAWWKTVDALEEAPPSALEASPLPAAPAPTPEDASPVAPTYGGPALEGGFLVVRTPDGREFVQVAAFALPSSARDMAAELRGITDHPVVVEEPVVGDRALHRVKIGPVPTPDERDTLAAALRTGGYGVASPATAPAQVLVVADEAAVPDAPLVVQDDGGRTYLQAGAYAEYHAADAIAYELRELTGYRVAVSDLARDGDTTLYRVRVGPVEAGAVEDVSQRIAAVAAKYRR